MYFIFLPSFALLICCCCVVSAGNALEKAGGREFLDGVKELRKAQGPLEVASGTCCPGIQEASAVKGHKCVDPSLHY